MHALVVLAHPSPTSFSASLAGQVQRTLADCGHTVDRVDLYGDDDRDREAPAEVATQRQRLAAAAALVLVHPTWWGGQPAILSQWLHHVVASPGEVNLRHIRRLIVVTTYGSPRWVNFCEGEPGRRTVWLGLRPRVHPLARCRRLTLYRMDTVTEDDRRGFTERVTRAVARI